MVESNQGWRNKTLVSPGELSKILDISEDTLAVWRCTNRYELPFVKVGRLVRYRPEDINAFIEARTRNYHEVRS